jgi:hypothetical protein
MRIIKLIGITVIAAFVATTFAVDKLYDSVTFSGYGAFQAGQLVRGYYYPQEQWAASALISHRWDESIRSQFSATFYKGAALKINIGTEFNDDFFTIIPTQSANDNATPGFTYYNELKIHRADMEYGFFSSDNCLLKLQFGYFPFKYNPQANNFGEYLFRSECYPNIIVNDFEWPETRLLGANLEALLWGTVRQNLLLTSETTYPTQDFSLAYLADADLLGDALELGAGIQASRIFPVDPSRTTPHTVADTIAVNPVTHDTSFYTFAGTKVMARVCFDIKKLAPMDFLGGEDLKIYGEGAILGLKNYGSYYNKISERMPVMFGFNVPAFKLLDLLSFEAEYYTSPYFNDDFKAVYPVDFYTPAIPDVESASSEQNNTDHGVVTTSDHRWKWSWLIKKSLGSNVQIIAQAARDHSRFQNPKYNEPYYLFDGDVTVGGKDWYYLVRLVWNI